MPCVFRPNALMTQPFTLIQARDRTPDLRLRADAAGWALSLGTMLNMSHGLRNDWPNGENNQHKPEAECDDGDQGGSYNQ